MKYLSLLILIILAFYACKPKVAYPPLVENTAQLRDEALKPFYHGVASGDPLENQVIIWTRVSPETQLPKVDVSWEVAEDKAFSQLIQEGIYMTGPERDYTVKIDVEGLEAGKVYFYRFKALGKTSASGTTKTASNQASALNLAVVSCSNYEWGYFNAYARIAEEENLDAVLHLGDYIYEYGPGKYGDTTIGRINIPDHEILSTQDYRDRYAQYRLDPDLQAVHAAHPFISIWDDHEITNNSYKDGAQNHQEDEGSYEERKARAKQVYYEWLPIRESDLHYRKISYGALADLWMLDERLAGRTQQADSASDPRRDMEEMSMLGNEQLRWLEDGMKSSTAKWKLIGNQVIYSYLDWGYETFRLNMDGWDGYPVEQEKVARIIQDNGISNVLFLTGDTHTSWAIEATNKPETYNPETSEGAFAVEFGAMSINSANSDERDIPVAAIKLHEQNIINSDLNPHLKYTNMRDHGYVLLNLSPEKARATFHFVETNRKRTKEMKPEIAFEVLSGETKLHRVDPIK
ncbi:MAG: alkaline phosphatase D family protein [Bacteroidota bacterium]